MIVVRFRSSEEHSDLLKKVKRMKKFTEELEEMLAECYEDSEDTDFRDAKMYRKEYEDDDTMYKSGRYGYHPSYRRSM